MAQHSASCGPCEVEHFADACLQPVWQTTITGLQGPCHSRNLHNYRAYNSVYNKLQQFGSAAATYQRAPGEEQSRRRV